MRISDWSSDVCSAYLLPVGARLPGPPESFDDPRRLIGVNGFGPAPALDLVRRGAGELIPAPVVPDRPAVLIREPAQMRHEERKRVVSGKRVSVRVSLGGRRIIKKTKK